VNLKRLWIGLLVVSALAAEPNLDELLRRTEARYNHARTLEVHFQEQYTKSGEPRRTESGILKLRKPGRMRWDYTQPKGKLFLSDGKSLYLYTPDDHHAERMKLQATEDMRAPLAFLLGKLHFNKEFRDIQSQPEGADTRITAAPKTDNLPYSKVEFVVTPEGQIREVKVTGFDRSVLDFQFDQEKMDPPLEAGLFQFQLPPGAQLTETDQ
jgi:outer membrane lipoprotein carrier protein